jgi:hypothetical protein
MEMAAGAIANSHFAVRMALMTSVASLIQPAAQRALSGRAARPTKSAVAQEQANLMVAVTPTSSIAALHRSAVAVAKLAFLSAV